MLDFVILALATWRLSSLFATERGPFAIFDRIRERCKGEMGLLIICPWCLSIWIGLIVSVFYYLYKESIVWMAMPLALSAATIIVEKILIENTETTRP